MATQYRTSRNLEASIIDFIKDKLNAGGWSNINVEKTFARVYEQDPPSICIRLSDTIWATAEVGSNSQTRNPLILIDLFCPNDGIRLDLKDFLISELKSGLPYYEYTILAGVVQSKNQNGRIKVTSISDTPIDLGVNKSALDVRDRYRHLISLSVSLGQVE